MRAFQFWTLILISTIVSGLMVKQIFLTRQLNLAQRTLSDSQQAITQGSGYENAWQKMAMSIYQAGHDDPALLEVLKKENVGVQPKAAPDAGSIPAPAPSLAAPVPSASSKAPTTLVHPATP